MTLGGLGLSGRASSEDLESDRLAGVRILQTLVGVALGQTRH